MKRLTLLLLIPLIGCSFHRAVVNDYVRDLDTAWIEPGVTTREDVIARLGFSPSDKEGGGVTGNSFRWVCNDSFGSTLEVGYILTPTFGRTRKHADEDILILFDDRGVVRLLSRTRGDGDNRRIVEWKEAKRR